jgi:hypothetical protein
MPDPSRYGKPNIDMLRTWIGRPPEDDGPFWAVNLMQYRPVADYGDGSAPTKSGREADDEYAPVEVLADLGAMIVLFADVTAQSDDEPAWDRVAIVRYPTRASFMAMQQRKDFQEKHVHKEAGMQFTIVMATLPAAAGGPNAIETRGRLVMRVARLAPGATLSTPPGTTRLATFDVEGVIIGDDRTWTTVAFDVATDDAGVAATLHETPGVEEQYAMVIDAQIDNIADSITSTESQGGGR